MKKYTSNSTWFLAALLIAVAFSYAVFEMMHNSALTEEQQAELANEALKSATQNYLEYEKEFAYNSRSLAQQLISELQDGAGRSQLFDLIRDEYEFWGTSIFRDGELWLWDAFAQKNYSSYLDDSTGQYVDVYQQNNVTFLFSQIPMVFSRGDSLVRFDLFTRKKIKQENILPIGKTSELNPSQIFFSDYDYPVYFSFFDTVEEPLHFKSVLSTQSVDSVGVAYTLSGGQALFQEALQNQHSLYRTIFAVLFILLGMLFLMSFAVNLPVWESLLLRVFSIFVAWMLLSNIKIGSEWMQIFEGLTSDNLRDIQLIFTYCLNTLFILTITLSVFNTFIKRILPDKVEEDKTVNPGFAVLHGFFGALFFHFYISQTYFLFVESSIPVVDLSVFPPLTTFIIYIASGVFAFSLILVLSFTVWYLFKQVRSGWWVLPFLMIAGFSAGSYAISFITSFPESYYWMVLTCSLFYFIVLSFSSAIYFNEYLLANSSRLRLLLAFAFLTVCITYIAVYMGNTKRLNNQMLKAAQSFIEEEASEAERIARTLIMDLENALSGLTLQDLEERPTYVENYFVQQTQQLIHDDWESFSISTQLVNKEGEIIGEYTSDLDSPGWTRAFNMLSLLIPFEEERIRINNLRPIVRERPLNEANSNYSSFRRAWIPLHENNSEQRRVGWILCSVYRERPQFDKPLRAVIAVESNETWNSSINVTEFINRKAARKSILGIPLELPGYVYLPDEIVKRVGSDSIFIQSTRFGEDRIRELYISTAEDQVIRAATTYTNIENHLFAILRYFFCVLIAGLMLLGLLSWKKELRILDHNRRFRDRLIDRFILASLLCLVVLTITSYYAIKNQNEVNIRTELLEKVNNLAEALTQQSPDEEESVNSLIELSTALDSDAALYQNASLDISTAGQIYEQHLLPEMLPWDIYNSIYNNGSNQETGKVMLGNLELLIGFQPWLNETGDIAGIVAIPTFLEAPKFNEQMLSTTSYLLGFYVLIFGLFILGAALISTQLTAPLHALRQGLKKISGGDLETVLPVHSKDEIGSLTNAYNIMVYRLKELQGELSKAEREAAWKEMAQQVAHEIKNPLTPMKLNLQHLERQLKVPASDFSKMKPNIEKIAANMIEQIESLNQIASDFSKFARPVQQSFKTIELNAVIRSATDLYASDEKHNIDLKLWQGDIIINGAKDELRRVLINLIKNAFEAMPDGGTVTLYSTVREQDNIVQFSVKDEGEGISAANQKDIFVPNFSTKTSGTGLGLAITKKIIEEHNGKISFESLHGQGTIFHVRLPLAVEEE